VNGVTSPSGETAAPAAASEQLAALGPFFAAGTHRPDVAPTAPWRPMSELAEDPAILTDRVHAARALLAAGGGQDVEAVELRVAASVIHLGLVARVVSPLLALAVLQGRTSPIALHDLRWQPTSGSTFPLSIADTVLVDRPEAEVSTPHTTPEDLAHALAVGPIEHVVTELCDAFRPFGVSPRVLWGNVASALNGACRILATARPDHAPRIRVVLNALLREPFLADTWQTSFDDRFQRRSCCLIYRAAPDRAGPLCGDCVLIGGNAGGRAGVPRASRKDAHGSQ